MRGSISSFLPKSTRSFGSRYVGRLNRSGAGHSANTSTSQNISSVTASELFKRVMGKPFIRQQDMKVVRGLSQHASSAATEAQRKFLKKYYERAKLNPGEVKKAMKGAYEVIEGQGFEKKFETGTIAEKVARGEKAIIKEHTPPPPPPPDNRMPLLRKIQAQAHAAYSSRGTAAPTMQEPTPLPKSSISSGWSKTPDNGATKTAAPAGTTAKTRHFSPLTSAFTGGFSVSRVTPGDQEDDDTKAVAPRGAPILSPTHGAFSGGRLTQPAQDRTDQPYDVVPATSTTTEAGNVADSSTPPPPPPPREGTPANTSEGSPI